MRDAAVLVGQRRRVVRGSSGREGDDGLWINEMRGWVGGSYGGGGAAVLRCGAAVRRGEEKVDVR